MSGSFYVYCLFRPNGLPFYIGKGTKKRMWDHEKPGRIGNCHKSNIIRQAQNNGLEIPKAILRDNLSEQEAYEVEEALIKAIGRHPDGPLVNRSHGGEGSNSGVERSEAWRAGISAANKGRIGPNVGRTFSEEARANMSAAHKGKPSTWKGKTASPETREKMRLAKLGRKLTEEHKAKITSSLLMSPPNKGRVFSEEVRSKMSKSRKLYFLRKQKMAVNTASIGD